MRIYYSLFLRNFHLFSLQMLCVFLIICFVIINLCLECVISTSFVFCLNEVTLLFKKKKKKRPLSLSKQTYKWINPFFRFLVFFFPVCTRTQYPERFHWYLGCSLWQHPGVLLSPTESPHRTAPMRWDRMAVQPPQHRQAGHEARRPPTAFSPSLCSGEPSAEVWQQENRRGTMGGGYLPPSPSADRKTPFPSTVRKPKL